MRILSLNLQAYGPFTEQTLDFRSSRPRLQILVGPNEAGKSSALRAISAALYGIPTDSKNQDAFLHSISNLRVGALLENDEGQSLEFLRRRTPKNFLRDRSDQQPLPDESVAAFLPNVDESFFRTMFGIDHAQLRQGGEEMAHGDGRMGELLFAAGGIVDLGRLQQDLQQQSEQLLSRAGRSGQLHAHNKEYKEKRKNLDRLQLSVEHWQTADEELQQQRQLKQQIETRLFAIQAEINSLSRLRQAVPLIHRLQADREKLDACGEVPVLDDAFTERRLKLQEELRIAERQATDAAHTFERLQGEVAEVGVEEELLNAEEAIEDLHQRLDSYRAALRDRPIRQQEHEDCGREIRRILEELGQHPELEDFSSLLIPRDKRTRIAQLIQNSEGVIARFENCEKEHERLRLRREAVQQQQAAAPVPIDPQPLRKALQSLSRQGNPEPELARGRRALAKTQEETQAALRSLPGWHGTLEELANTAVPLMETVERYQREFQQAVGDRQRLEEQIQHSQQTLEGLSAEITQLQAGQEIPTEDALQQAREIRDFGWHLIVNQLEGNPESPDVQSFRDHFPQADTLPAAFEKSVQQADELADRLRREADRVAQQATLNHQAARETARLREFETRLSELDADAEARRRAWEEQWSGVPFEPLPPVEMVAWLRRYQVLVEQAREIQSRQNEIESLEAEVRRSQLKLWPFLRSAEGEVVPENITLADLLEEAQEQVERRVAEQNQHVQFERELRSLQDSLQEGNSELKAAQQELQQWRDDWAAAMQLLGLENDAQPNQAHSVLDHLTELFQHVQERDNLANRLEEIDAHLERFHQDVRGLNCQFPDGTKNLAWDAVVVRLKAGLAESQRNRQRLQSLSRQREQVQHQLEEARQQIDFCQSEFKTLCRIAGTDQVEDLPRIEENFRKHQHLEASLAENEQLLLPLQGNGSLDEFIEQALQADVDQLKPRQDALQSEAEQIQADRDLIVAEIARMERELEAMNASHGAALAAQDCEALATKIGDDVQEYLVLHTAALVLNQAIERYREKNQGPVLSRASQFFAELTLGSFEALRADYDEHLTPMLVGIRADSRAVVPVSGMSEGTQDQLFLALRLASLDYWLQQHERMPLIVDDILMAFDDARSAATLKVLAELAQRTQILFFTHHQHLVEIAKQSLDAEDWQLLELSGGSPSSVSKKPGAKSSRDDQLAAHGAG